MSNSDHLNQSNINNEETNLETTLQNLSLNDNKSSSSSNDDHESGYSTPISKNYNNNNNNLQLQTPPLDEDHDLNIKKEVQLDPINLSEFHKCFQNFKDKYSHKESFHIKCESKDQTTIILSPLSYLHEFSRDWVTKKYLSTIVERPQRLMACTMGISAALSMFPSFFNIISSDKHTSLNSPSVVKIHGKEWPKQLDELCEQAESKLKDKKIEVPDDWNSGDIYLAKGTVKALEGVIGSVETGVDTIFSEKDLSKRTFVAVRPPGHHAHPSSPSGFCLINNVHVSIQYAYDNYDVTHAVILDFDLHHGDGSQNICWKLAGFQPDYDDNQPNEKEIELIKKNTPKIGYFSLHDINSFPCELGYAIPQNLKNASTCIMAHDLNIWNIHLQKWENENEFYEIYNSNYRTLLNKAHEFFKSAKLENQKLYNSLFIDNTRKIKDSELLRKNFKPFKGMIVISAGFDASEYEDQSMQRHGVNVPTSFYNKFTLDTLKLAQEHTEGRVLSVMEGGYSDGAISSGVFSHLVGLQGQKWNNEWSDNKVIKEFVKGCKYKWHPAKKLTPLTSWTSEVITLGRSMWPSDILNQSKEANNSKNNTRKSSPRELRDLANYNIGGSSDSNSDESHRRYFLRDRKSIHSPDYYEPEVDAHNHIKKEKSQSPTPSSIPNGDAIPKSQPLDTDIRDNNVTISNYNANPRLTQIAIKPAHENELPKNSFNGKQLQSPTSDTSSDTSSRTTPIETTASDLKHRFVKVDGQWRLIN